jgi:hypothetical protein
MITFILFIVVSLLALVCVLTSLETATLAEVRRRYAVLRENPPVGMEKLKNPVVLFWFTKTRQEIGYNVNKGSEIGLCVDGTPNDIFHVLMHELAHTVTLSFAHNDMFWQNFDILKKHCIELGIYEPIKEKKEFCGKFIRD